MIQSIAPRFTTPTVPTQIESTPSNPTDSHPLPVDSCAIRRATVAGGLFCGAVSALGTIAVVGGAALLGVPFAGAGAVTAAVVGSTVFGGTLCALTLPKSFDPPAGTDVDFESSRGEVSRNFPAPRRDAASMALAENQMWNAFSAARSAATAEQASSLAADGTERIAEILGHGALRTSSLIVGVAAGLASANPLLGVPLGFAAAFGASYILDKPGHLLGRFLGRAAGGAVGRALQGS
jgi:hypothetical protein